MRTIVLDPGHGGKDPGAVSDDFPDVVEKDIVLAIGLLTRRYLNNTFRDVVPRMTRHDDVFVELSKRVQFAVDARADFFLAIHINARPTNISEVPGFEIETYWYKQKDKVPAEIIHNHALSLVNAKDRGLKTEPFYVIKNTKCPAALIELGFVTDSDDVPQLTDISFQRQIALVLGESVGEAVGLERDPTA